MPSREGHPGHACPSMGLTGSYTLAIRREFHTLADRPILSDISVRTGIQWAARDCRYRSDSAWFGRASSPPGGGNELAEPPPMTPPLQARKD